MSGSSEIQKPTLIPDAKKLLESEKSNSESEGSKKNDTEKTSLMTYGLIVVFVILVILLLYYAYNQFYANSEDESSDTTKAGDKKSKQKDEMISDYNLAEAIDHLEKKQNQILRRLSDDVGL